MQLVVDSTHFRIAIVGDLHTHWDDFDLRDFAQSEYDLVYFTGDLGGGTKDSTLRVARNIARLDKTALVMPGNNDTFEIDLLAAELAHQNGLHRLRALSGASEHTPIKLCGYSLHELSLANDLRFSLIAARPHSLGGAELSFPEYMAETYDIPSMDHSSQRLKQLVDEATSENLIFLSHNGPHGLGGNHDDMWGADFREDAGDWGDPDLTETINHARSAGKQVHAVIAGHMHLLTDQGVERPWKRIIDDTTYINAARVPRIFAEDDNVHRHHVALTLSAEGVDAQEVLVAQYA
jgi:uncharacterized protein (TIGR04168 family)